jgi:hypothetical protein
MRRAPESQELAVLDAEASLRTAIIPPLVALMSYLTASESLIWLLGIAVAVAMLGQALGQRVSAIRTTDRLRRARNVELLRPGLEEVARKLSVGDGIEAKRLRIDLEELSRELFVEKQTSAS